MAYRYNVLLKTLFRHDGDGIIRRRLDVGILLLSGFHAPATCSANGVVSGAGATSIGDWLPIAVDGVPI